MYISVHHPLNPLRPFHQDSRVLLVHFTSLLVVNMQQLPCNISPDIADDIQFISSKNDLINFSETFLASYLIGKVLFHTELNQLLIVGLLKQGIIIFHPFQMKIMQYVLPFCSLANLYLAAAVWTRL